MFRNILKFYDPKTQRLELHPRRKPPSPDHIFGFHDSTEATSGLAAASIKTAKYNGSIQQLIVMVSQTMEQPQPMTVVPEDNRTMNSYLFWLLFFMGFGGIHRLYNGKIGTGLLWLFTGGLFGIGQIVDLILIPDMASERRIRLLAKSGALRPGMTVGRSVASQPVTLSHEQQMVRLLEVARERGGKLTVPQAVMAMQLSFEEVEALLLDMHRKGYAAMDNDVETGVIVYEFVGL